MKNSKGLFVKNTNKWRVPRKLKKKIPKDTFYCYTPLTNPGFMENGSWGFKIKPCPFSTYIKFKEMNPKPKWISQDFIDEFGEDEVNWCKLAKTDIEDQCKSCGLRYPKLN